MANDDDKLILHEKKHNELLFLPVASGAMFPLTFTVPDHDSLVKKPKGIFNINMAIGAVAFATLAFVLAPATLATGTIAAITAGSAVAGGLLTGITSNHIRTKRYNTALQQKAERIEQAQTKGLSPEQAEDIEKEARNDFQEAEKKRHNAVGILPAAISGR